MLTISACTSEADYARVRDFLRTLDMWKECGLMAYPLARLEYWRWHVRAIAPQPPMSETLLLAEVEGNVAAVISPENWGDALLHIHPAQRTRAVESALIAIAEERLARTEADGGRVLEIWAHASDALLPELLAERGYVRGAWPESEWVRRLDGSAQAPAPTLPVGYTLRALGDDSELPSRSWASWRAFHPNEPDSAYQGHAWYAQNIQRNPLYRQDLDLVTIASDGSVAGFCTVWYDQVTRLGYFEPVGVVPEHQRRGLARALLMEGMRRVQALGATCATVAGYSQAANALYAQVTGAQPLINTQWRKQWPA
jgi:ribosomal protein S18 acetylase RimI-like enzyme